MKKLIVLGGTIALLWFSNAQAGFVPFAEDTLAWKSSEDELKAQGDWADTETSFSYTVNEGTNDSVGNDAGKWEYIYTLDVPKKDISHLIVEVSDTFGEDNIIGDNTSNVQNREIKKHKTNDSNPGMPADVFGIKWDLQDDNTKFTASLISDRDPMWGDFFSKDGKSDGVFNSVWNAGFTSDDTDPSINLASIRNSNSNLVQDHIMVPDTTTNGGGPPQRVPEPGTLMLLGLGLLGMQALLFRRRLGQPSPSV